jgi:hypothetical protein
MSAPGAHPPAAALLPPSLIHELRTRSFPRLFRMTGNPGNRGFGRVLRKRIGDLVQRERTMVERAITVAYMGSYLVDHIVQAEKLATRLLDQRDLTEAEEHHLWEQSYGKVILQLATELPDGTALLDEVGRLSAYDRLPRRLHAFRERHWARVARFLGHAPDCLPPPRSGVCLLTRVEEALDSARPPRNKALAVALFASMLADRICYTEHQSWPAAYRETMIDLYPMLVRHGDVLSELIRLDAD